MTERRTATNHAFAAHALLAFLAAVTLLGLMAGAAHAAKSVADTFGTSSGSPALGGTFNEPGGIAVRHSTGQIYVYDTDNRRVQRFSREGDFQRAWGWDVIQSGAPGDTGTDFEICTVAADCKIGEDGSGAGQFGATGNPGGVAVDQVTGAVYTTDSANRRIQKFDADGNFLRLWGRNVVSTGPGNADERQRITVNATAGTFTLSFDGQTTSPIAFDASATAVQAELEGLSNLAPGDVIVSGGPGGAGGTNPYIAQFAGTRADTDLIQMTASGASLSGDGSSASVATLVDGAIGFEVCVPADGDTCTAGADGSLGGELRSSTNTIAVDAAGNVLVGEGTNRRIQKFDSDGDPLRTWGWDVVSSGPGNVGSGNEEQVVTVNATGGTFTLTFDGNTTGPIPFNTSAATVQQALMQLPRGVTALNAPNFQVTGATGTASTPGGPWTITFVQELARTNFPGLTASSAGLTGGTSTVSVSTSADGADYEVCVPAAGDICQLAASGKVEVGKFLTSPDPNIFLAVDSSNRVYASDASAGRVQRFEPDGSAPMVFAPGELSSSAVDTATRQITVDRTDDHLYAVKAPSADAERQVKEILPDGSLAPDGVHEAGVTSVNGIALDELHADERLYLTSEQFQDWVIVLDKDGGFQSCTCTVQPATDVGVHTATLNGTIDPNGFETSYRFEYSLDGLDWTPVGAFESVGSGTTEVPISKTISGLQANQLYYFRFVTSAAIGGITATSQLNFTTLDSGPEVTTGGVQQITSHSAQVRGRINPNNLSTSYHVEYGTTPSYGSTAPVPDATATGGIEKTYVVQLSGLAASTTYHYRFVATNSEGSDAGDDMTFTTSEVPAPPDGSARAYEMVTPPDKSGRVGGQDTHVDSPLVGIPSADGESLVANTKWILMDAEAGGSIPHLINTLLIKRSPTGWKGEALNNVAPNAPSVAGLTNPAGMSEDLDVQAWQHNEWLFPSKSPLGTRVFGDPGGTIPGTGWYDWLGSGYDWRADPDNKIEGEMQVDAALITEDGGAMVRWGGAGATYRGLLGSTVAEDPSNAQTAGDAIYRQAPAGPGPRELVNECTGTGVGATRIPMIDDKGTPGSSADDEIGSQACQAGTVTSPLGAAAGGARPTSNPISGTLVRALSEDGNRIIFSSPDPNAAGVPASCSSTGAATSCPPQLFIRQYDAGGTPTVRWISRSAVAGQAATLFGSGAAYEGASDDAKVIYFKTNAPLTPDDPNGTGTPGPKTTGAASDSSWDLYRYELPGDNNVDPAGGTLMRISGGPDGPDPDITPGDFDPNVLDVGSAAGVLRFLSDDGTKAYFTTRDVLGSPSANWNQAPDRGTTTAGSGLTNERNLYLFDATKSGNDRWSFIARIPYGSGGIGDCASRYQNSGMAQNPFDDPSPFNPSIPAIGRNKVNCVHGLPNGRAIAFETTGQLTGDDGDGAGDIYLYDADSDAITRVSAPPSDESGYICDAPSGRCNATLGRSYLSLPDYETIGLNGAQNQNFAEDGNQVVSLFFESRVPLVGEDVDESDMDVYEWRAGELSLISPAGSDDGAYFSGNTVDGEDVFFATAEAIDPREIDADFDIYDARVGGGIPLPPAPGPQCEALAGGCQGPGGGAPVDDGAESGNPGGGGNVQPGPRVSLSVKRPSARGLRRAARSGVLALKVSASAPGTVRIAVRARVGGRSRVVGSAVKRLTRAGSATVKVRLARMAVRQLRRKKALSLEVRASMPGARSRTLPLRLQRGRR